MFEKMKLGLALGGGGARGLAHLGVMKALEQAGTSVSCVAGTSAGALVGATYLVYGSVAAAEKRLAEFMASELFRASGIPLMHNAFHERPGNLSQRLQTWLRRTYFQAKAVAGPAMLEAAVFRNVINFFIPKINIEDLPVPFCAVGTDLKSGRAVVFRTGSLQAAVYASTALPGIVRPLAMNDLLVVDGGVVNLVPVMAARHLGADAVVAVDVEKNNQAEEDFRNAINIFFRIEDILGTHLKELELRQADIVVRPNVGHIHWSDFERGQEMIRLGNDAASEQLDRIKAIARRRKMPWASRGAALSTPAVDWIEV